MAKVKIDHIQPGMLVKTDVRNMDGMLLMPAGTELSERHIHLLRTWGVSEIVVEQCGSETAVANTANNQDKPEAELVEAMKARFWNMDEMNPVQEMIFNLMVRRKKKTSF